MDFRFLNQKTVKDCFPLPIIEECLDTLQGNTYFSTLGLSSGYYQIKMADKDRKKIALITRYGLFEHTRMGMGLCYAPTTFQRPMQLVLRGMIWTQVLVYIDDIIVLGKNVDCALQHLRNVFERMRGYNLRLKPTKCELFQLEVEFLGKLINAEGISIAPGKKQAVLNWPTPTHTKECMSFLGFVNNHRDHVPDFVTITCCLYELADSKDFVWLSRHETSFQQIKQALTFASCLVYPTQEGAFILDTDASYNYIGAVLSQVQNNEENAMYY